MNRVDINFKFNDKLIWSNEALLSLVLNVDMKSLVKLIINRKAIIDEKESEIITFVPDTTIMDFLNHWFCYNKQSLESSKLKEHVNSLLYSDIVYDIKAQDNECDIVLRITEKYSNKDYQFKYTKATANDKDINLLTLMDLSGPIRIPGDANQLTRDQLYDILIQAYPELQSLKDKGYRLVKYSITPHFNESYLHRVDLTEQERTNAATLYNLNRAEFCLQEYIDQIF